MQTTITTTNRAKVLIDRQTFDVLMAYIHDMQVESEIHVNNLMRLMSDKSLIGSIKPKTFSSEDAKLCWLLGKPSDFFSEEIANKRLDEYTNDIITEELIQFPEGSVIDETKSCLSSIRHLEKMWQISNAFMEYCDKL